MSVGSIAYCYGMKANSRKMTGEGFGRRDDNTLVISTLAAGADVIQITVNGAFLSSKSHTRSERVSRPAFTASVCVFMGLQEAESLVTHSQVNRDMRARHREPKHLNI